MFDAKFLDNDVCVSDGKICFCESVLSNCLKSLNCSNYAICRPILLFLFFFQLSLGCLFVFSLCSLPVQFVASCSLLFS